MPGFEGVDFGYHPGHELLRSFDLALPETGVVALLGPSGCGKTTLLRLLAGLERPLAGGVVGVGDRRVAMVFQEDRLLPWETAAQNATGSPDAGEDAVAELAALGLGSDASRYPEELSGGMKRRVAIARALAAPHDLLLLDEPFTGLDEGAWQAAADRIRADATGRLVVLVTHLPDQATAVAATVVRLAGPPLRVVRAPGSQPAR